MLSLEEVTAACLAGLIVDVFICRYIIILLDLHEMILNQFLIDPNLIIIEVWEWTRLENWLILV